jgi:undecaprenyl-phosphate galactose phosphotransferase
LAYYTRVATAKIFASLPLFNFCFVHFLKIWWIALIFIFFLVYSRLYSKRLSFWDETKEIIKAVTTAIVVVFSLVSLGKMTGRVSRLLLLFLWFYALFLFPILKLWIKRFLYNVDLWLEDVIVLGAGEAGLATATGLIQDKHMGYRVRGFLDDNPEKLGTEVEILDRKYEILGSLKDFNNIVDTLGTETVVVAMPSLESAKLTDLVNEVQRHVKRVLVVPELKGISLINTELYHLFMEELFLLKINNNLLLEGNQILKRAFDIFAFLLLLPVLFLMIVVIAVLIKLDSPGPVFFVQERLGRNGEIFRFIKFRSMYVDADNILREYLQKDSQAMEDWRKFKKLRGIDPRVTRVGRFLRKTSLDEIPQFLHVLKGEMSLVGPRPYLPREREDMGSYATNILLTRPGMTGLWQVSGRNELDFEHRLKLDAWYVINWSLWLDLVVLFKTIRVVLCRKGAY